MKLQVEDTIFVSFFPALIMFIPLLVLEVTHLTSVKSLSLCEWMILPSTTLFGLHIALSVLLGARFRFTFQQFKLLGKYVLLIDVILPALLLAYLFPVAAAVVSTNSELLISIRKLILLAPLLMFFLTLFVGKKIFDRHLTGWFSIRETSQRTVRNDPLKLYMKAQHEQQRGNHEGAGEAYSFAAWTYADMEQWKEAAESFQRAAEAYSNDRNLQFGSVCNYCFAAACFIISGDGEHANNTIQTGKHALSDKNIDSKGWETVSKILTFFELVQNGETEKAQNAWRILEPKIPEWMYPFPDQARNLLEKCLEQRHDGPH